MSKSSRRRAASGTVAVVAVVVAVFAVAAVAGMARDDRDTVGDVAAPTAEATTAVATSPQDVVAEVLKAGTDPAFAATGAVVDASEFGADAGTPGITLTVTSPSGATDGAFLLPEWQAAVAAGAIADLLSASGSRPPSAFTVYVVGADGAELDGSGSAIPDAKDADLQHRTDADDDALRASVTAAVDGAGWSTSSVEILHPLGSAVVVDARVPEGVTPTSDQLSRLYRDIVSSTGSGTCALEGLYVELSDVDGLPLATMADACRLNTGFSWARPDGPITIVHAGPAEGPLPCGG